MSQPAYLINIKPQHNPTNHSLPQLSQLDRIWRGRFKAMASDCEVLFEGVDKLLAENLLRVAAQETWRIEYKYSRYRCDNVMAQLNDSNGEKLEIDQETNALLSFADQCYQLSDGLFDITSGVLRNIWHFDGSDNIPSEEQITRILPLIGWHKVHRETHGSVYYLSLPNGMELDFGGLGKEYAVDRSLFLIQQRLSQSKTLKTSVLVNYGGDLACSGLRLTGEPWRVAVESIKQNNKAVAQVSVSHGAVATSGDANRFLLKNGVRYSHVLNPKTGCSVTDAPHSVSVSGATCMQAGMLSTIASLNGQDAEAFLEAQGLEYWLQR